MTSSRLGGWLRPAVSSSSHRRVRSSPRPRVAGRRRGRVRSSGTGRSISSARRVAAADRHAASRRRAAKSPTRSSNARGEFTFEGVPEGRYQVEVTRDRIRAAHDRPGVRRRARTRHHRGRLQIGARDATRRRDRRGGRGAAVADRRGGHGDRRDDARRARQHRSARAAAHGARRGGRPDRRARRRDVAVRARRRVELQQGADRRRAGQRHRRRLRLLAIWRRPASSASRCCAASNSVLYGSDALTGVINITTRRGRTRMPEGDALDRRRQPRHVCTKTRRSAARSTRFDYFAEFSHLQTDNNVPNNDYRNNTFATPARRGARHDDRACSGTVRHIDTTFGSPNAFDFYGIADDSSQDADDARTRRSRRSRRCQPRGRARCASASPIRTITS